VDGHSHHKEQRCCQEEGILVKIKGVYKQKTENDNYYEILVLESEAEEAKDILVEKGF